MHGVRAVEHEVRVWEMEWSFIGSGMFYYRALVKLSSIDRSMFTKSLGTTGIGARGRCRQGRTEGGNGASIPRALNQRGTKKCHNDVVSAFSNTWSAIAPDAKLASCPGRHLTSDRPWLLATARCCSYRTSQSEKLNARKTQLP